MPEELSAYIKRSFSVPNLKHVNLAQDTLRRQFLCAKFVYIYEETRGIIILSFYTEDATMKQDIKQSLPYGTAPGIEC